MWNHYYMNIAKAVAENSKCLSRKIGSVLVKGKSIVSTGYNGPPTGVPTCDTRSTVPGICPRQAIGARSGERLDLCIAAHSERNAIVQAAKLGIATEGCKLVCYCGPPCKDCLVEIINAGIREVVCLHLPFYDHLSEYLISESGLVLTRLLD